MSSPLLLWSSSNDVYLALKEEEEQEVGETREVGGGFDEELTEDHLTGSYMSMTQPKINCRLVDASIQKNISFEGKPVTPTSWNGGFGEVFSLRDQLKQAEERASLVQREVKVFYLLANFICTVYYQYHLWVFFKSTHNPRVSPAQANS